MYQDFLDYLKTKLQISETEFELIQETLIHKNIKRRKFLLQEGEIWRYYAFVLKGLLRTYSVDDRGVEHIIDFSLENSWTGDMESYSSEIPSNLNIDALEDSEVILISKVNFEKLLNEIPDFAKFMKKLFEISFIESQNRVLSNISLTSEQKYTNFLDKFQDVHPRFPQHMIASYLGISAETLSRIRNQNTKKI
ncbi:MULTISPECIES: Crp/Fnr family transcriptional regulator [Flavobacterium]|uniref:Crp/Fnr family transcriptional regulator n=1 Tax=Flavobacterium TaxID=237 RepID=UPI00211400EF|nr:MULTISPECIES: Crp/Fnr family transcriptional regulator [Flavobacterium]UUF12889.1 Crp/Fnr family transcriptional regulator [Flavobacterium panici]